MEKAEEKSLPSGAFLTVTLAPFADAKALYKAALKELKGLDIKESDEIDLNLFKNVFSSFFSSDEIEKALSPCMARCLYNGQRIVASTFEPAESREDYAIVCWEVAYANISPFLKNLGQLSATAIKSLGSASQKSP